MTRKQIIKMFKLTEQEINKIDQYLEVLKKQNKSINLVGKSTLLNAWDRHVGDSLQIIQFIKNKQCSIIDIGTGAGIPGIILAILGYKKITMVDSIRKKTDFVEKTLELLDIKAQVINSRIENLRSQPFEFIISRALAPLNKLLYYSLGLSDKNSKLIFLKGRKMNEEILLAQKNFRFDYRTQKNKSEGGGFVLEINSLGRND